MRTLPLVLALLIVVPSPAAADDGPAFRRTTPRAVLAVSGNALVLGVPGGRAWGIESALRRAPRGPAELVIDVEVADEAVREAFVRIAWYERETGRQRQIAIVDSALVRDGARRTLVVALDPPDGAVAYRVRVLARLVRGEDRSRDDAIDAALPWVRALARPGLTRLIPP